eukprot:gene15-20_t
MPLVSNSLILILFTSGYFIIKFVHAPLIKYASVTEHISSISLCMQKLRLNQKLVHKLTPQQIQLIKLLQVPSIDMHARIQQEMAENPVLETDHEPESLGEAANEDGEVDLSVGYGDEFSDHMRGTRRDYQMEDRWPRKEDAVPAGHSFQEYLLDQLEMLHLDEWQHKIGTYLIGSLEADGYIRRDLAALANDLLLSQYIETDEDEVASVLKKIQTLDPPGIGARNLQECLLIQLHKQVTRPAREVAIKIVSGFFELFIKKHYPQIQKRLSPGEEEFFKEALDMIAKLNPKPGGILGTEIQQNPILYPDFIITRHNQQLEVRLNTYHTPGLKLSKSYMDMLGDGQKVGKEGHLGAALQEATVFVKKKVDAARWFIEALNQRKVTLLRTMQAIMQLQYDFFMDEDESKLKPMILKDVAQIIEMDISTVSRIVNNKSVQAQRGTYLLKFFFTEAISTDEGEDVSSKAVKQLLLELIQEENKQRPYADDQLTALLVEKGYHIARRTVAKYREQLHIPVARLRKQLFISGMVGIPLIIGLLYWSAWGYFVIFLGILVGTIWEFYGLLNKEGETALRSWGTLTSVLMYILSFLYLQGWISGKWLTFMVPVFASIYFIMLYRKETLHPFKVIGYSWLGIIYVGLPFSLLHFVAFKNLTYHYECIWGVLLAIWANDIGAYLVGSFWRFWKRHLLFPRVSPKKSWEGSVGGALLSLLVTYILSLYFTHWSIIQWILLGVLASLIGTYGDLVESLLKRSLQIKDSGSIIPGHGGFLDRFDSFLLVVPFVVMLELFT